MQTFFQQPSWQQLAAREMLAGLGLGALYPFGMRAPKRLARPHVEPERRTVIFVHGYLANRSCFLPLSAYLRLHGIREQRSFQYESKGGAERAAVKLKQFLKQEVRGGRIDLIGHSLGGIIARIYLQMLGGARRTDRCITLGSPHFGTYNAYWVPSRVGRELRPESPLMTRLHQTKQAAQSVKFVSITGDTDNIILPRLSASHETTHTIQSAGHLGLLWSPQMMSLVHDSLRT